MDASHTGAETPSTSDPSPDVFWSSETSSRSVELPVFKQRSQVKPLDCSFEDVTPTRACLHSEKRRASSRSALQVRIDLALNDAESMCPLDHGQTGVVYKVASQTSPLAVFKPECEEGFARRGIPPGTGALREEAAYLLDRLTESSAGVPVTIRTQVPMSEQRQVSDASNASTSATCSGSVQRFVSSVAGPSSDFAMPRDLAAASSVLETGRIQQVAAFDIRVCNTDRHCGNLLFSSRQSSPDDNSRYSPVPIDHGCILPRWWAMEETNFEAWLDWPQLSVPCLPHVLNTVETAFASRDEAVETLIRNGVDHAAATSYRIGVSLLREGVVRHGLCLASVAALMTRDPSDFAEPSWLELQIASIGEELGFAIRWTENKYGDRIIEEPEEPEASLPASLIDGLDSLFRSSELLNACKSWEAKNLSTRSSE